MNPLRKVNLGMKLLSLGQVREAEQFSLKLLADAPNSAAVFAFASEVAKTQNHMDVALSRIERAIELDSQDPTFQFKKAEIELTDRQGLKAQETASEIAERFPDDPHVQLEAARIMGKCGNHARAENFLLNAGAKETSDPEVLVEFSINQFFMGNTSEAERAIKNYLALGLPGNGQTLLLRSQLRKQTKDQNHVDALRDCLARPLPTKEAIKIYYALARELEDLGEYSQSFDALKSGAALQRSLIEFNLSDELEKFNDLINTFNTSEFSKIPDSTSKESPIFIVGLPRSGTTLVERIIGQQEGLKSAEETYDFTMAFSSVINQHIAAHPNQNLNPLSAALEVDYSEIAGKYHASMLGMLGEADRFIDKTPFHFIYCGLIKKAFPKARILHLVRDPMDTCFAVFKILFAQAYFFSYDLSELAGYYIGYRKLMDHWHGLMPGEILDVRYEELVADPLEVSRRIAEYVGFEWSSELVEVENATKQCSTASAMQVREPIYTSSVGRWRKFEAELQPLKEKLEAANIVDSDGNSLI